MLIIAICRYTVNTNQKTKLLTPYFYGLNWRGIKSKDARKTLPTKLWTIAVRKLDQLDSVTMIDELKVPPGNHLEKLKDDRTGQYSIRINRQYRVCFSWTDSGPEDVEITDYHY